MIDLISLAAVASAGWLGYRFGSRRRKPPKEPEAICGCGHHYSMHDEQGVCQRVWSERVLVERGQPRSVKTGSDGFFHKVVYDHQRWESIKHRCSCRRYTGPEPLPRFVS